MHTTYQQTVAATGPAEFQRSRISRTSPSARKRDAPSGRHSFPRDEEHVLVAADYSQVELRIAAALEQRLRPRRGVHPRARRAYRHCGQGLRRSEPEERGPWRCAARPKPSTLGFFTVRERSDWPKTSGFPRREAKEIIDAYFVQFAQLKAFHGGLCRGRAGERVRGDRARSSPVFAGHSIQQCDGAGFRRAKCSECSNPRLCSRYH